MAGNDDGGPDNQLREMPEDQAAASLARNPAQSGATNRRTLRDQERRLGEELAQPAPGKLRRRRPRVHCSSPGGGGMT